MMAVRGTDSLDLIEEHDSGIARSLHHPDPPGSVPAIRDIPIGEVNRVLFRTQGGARRMRRRTVDGCT
jgi:hypothetical protein